MGLEPLFLKRLYREDDIDICQRAVGRSARKVRRWQERRIRGIDRCVCVCARARARVYIAWVDLWQTKNKMLETKKRRCAAGRAGCGRGGQPLMLRVPPPSESGGEPPSNAWAELAPSCHPPPIPHESATHTPYAPACYRARRIEGGYSHLRAEGRGGGPERLRSSPVSSAGACRAPPGTARRRPPRRSARRWESRCRGPTLPSSRR